MKRWSQSELAELLRNLPQQLSADQQQRLQEAPALMRWLLDDSQIKYWRRAAALRRCPTQSVWKPSVQLPGAGCVLVPVKLRCVHDWPASAPAWMLPIQWVRDDGEHDVRVPQALRELADTVARSLCESESVRDRFAHAPRDPAKFRIRFAPVDGWDAVDLSDLHSLDPASAWAPLAAGLISLWNRQPLDPMPMVTGNFANGRWSVQRDTLPDKLARAVAVGARRFAVPMEHLGESQSILGELGIEHDQVIGLTNCPDPAIAIQQVLVMCGQPPQRESSTRKQREDWYLNIPNRKDAQRYYEDNLMSDVAAMHRDAIQRDGRLQNWRPRHLVSIVSTADELILLALETFGMRECTLIYTMGGALNMKRNFEHLEARVAQRFDGAVTVHPRPVKESVSGLAEIVEVVRNVPRQQPGDVLLDATPALRVMQLYALQAVQQGDYVMCWWHETHPYLRRVLPFRVKPLIWEVARGNSLTPIFGAEEPAVAV